MQELHELDDPGNIADYSELSPEEIRNKLIWNWFRFFRQNPNFKEYCEVRRAPNVKRRVALETDFRKIAELYEDWGDIHILPAMYEDSEDWENWLSKKNHLFPPTAIKRYDNLDCGVNRGNFLASIPTGYSKKQLCTLFDQFLDAHPEVIGQHSKYGFNVPRNKSWLETLVRLEQADVVNDLIKESELKLSHAKIVHLASITPLLQKLGFVWRASTDEKSKERTVMNYAKFYCKSVQVTVWGIFPAKLKT